MIRGLKEMEADEKGSLAEAVRVLGSEMGQIRRILDIGLWDVAEAMSWWMEDHQLEVPEEEWHSENEAEVKEEARDLVEEKQVFREFLKEQGMGNGRGIPPDIPLPIPT